MTDAVAVTPGVEDAAPARAEDVAGLPPTFDPDPEPVVPLKPVSVHE